MTWYETTAFALALVGPPMAFLARELWRRMANPITKKGDRT